MKSNVKLILYYCKYEVKCEAYFISSVNMKSNVKLLNKIKKTIF